MALCDFCDKKRFTSPYWTVSNDSEVVCVVHVPNAKTIKYKFVCAHHKSQIEVLITDKNKYSSCWVLLPLEEYERLTK